MIKDCPYCRKPVDIPATLESGWYVCPYDDCSKTFFFNKDTSTLHKIEEPTEEILGDEIVIICPNPDCRQKLRIPKATGTLQVTCPKCRTSFRYPTRRKEAQHDISGLLAEFDKALEDFLTFGVCEIQGQGLFPGIDGKIVGVHLLFMEDVISYEPVGISIDRVFQPYHGHGGSLSDLSACPGRHGRDNFSRAWRMIVSRSRGTFGFIVRGASGSLKRMAS